MFCQSTGRQNFVDFTNYIFKYIFNLFSPLKCSNPRVDYLVFFLKTCQCVQDGHEKRKYVKTYLNRGEVQQVSMHGGDDYGLASLGYAMLSLARIGKCNAGLGYNWLDLSTWLDQFGIGQAWIYLFGHGLAINYNASLGLAQLCQPRLALAQHSLAWHVLDVSWHSLPCLCLAQLGQFGIGQAWIYLVWYGLAIMLVLVWLCLAKLAWFGFALLALVSSLAWHVQAQLDLPWLGFVCQGLLIQAPLCVQVGGSRE